MKRFSIVIVAVVVALAAWCQDDTTTLSPTQMAVQADAELQESVVSQPSQPVEQEPVEQTVVMVSAIDIVLALLALVSLFVAWSTRSSLAKLKKNYAQDIEAINASMQKLAEETAKHIENIERRQAGLAQAGKSTDKPRRAVVNAKNEMPAGNDSPVKTLYLSKPDENECFSRVSEEFELGNSIYVLKTHDGVRGEFSVIDNRDVHSFALMMPGENLIRACSGNSIQMSTGKSRIVTDNPGIAVIENGKWHVSRKAVIHYE